MTLSQRFRVSLEEAPVAPFGGLSSALLLGLGASLSLGLCASDASRRSALTLLLVPDILSYALA